MRPEHSPKGFKLRKFLIKMPKVITVFGATGGQGGGVVSALLKVARYSFSGSIPPKFERKLRRHKQRFGKINTTVVLDKDENLL